MAKIKNVSGEDRLVPWLGGRLVLDGQVVDVPDRDVPAYCCQTETWSPADAATKKLAAPVVDDNTPQEG